MSKPVKPAGIPRMVLLAVALVLPAASLIPLGSLWLWERGYILYLGALQLHRRVRHLLSAAPPDDWPFGRRSARRGRGCSAGRFRWSPKQDEAWPTSRRSRQMSMRAGCRAGMPSSISGSRPSRWWPSACIRSAPILSCNLPSQRPWPSSSRPAPVCATSSAAASAGRPGHRRAAHVAVSLARGAGPRREGLRPVAHRASAQPGLCCHPGTTRRFTRQIYDAGREHLARRLARAFVREVGAPPSTSTVAA